MSSFDSIKAVNHTAFESKEKSKDYTRFLKRVDRIERRKPSIDHSSGFYMSVLRQYKQSANQLARQETNSVIELENCVLLEKLANIQRRKIEKNVEYEVSGYLKRKREMEQINQQNQAMAARLAERYAKCRQPFANLSLHCKSNSGRSRTNQSHHKLPKLNHKKPVTQQQSDDVKQEN